ncbi:hypothetical protein Z517_10801 [Fonsecaea pedrosoi CBS 271.37]|uniref:Pre-rRNA-processing protein RIX1 n=1 Tax=Fonsecaea pedrosoi CBS 271.37 TaxID=1442368 RepID=A0A0D2DEI2_9EURO|nr:uncharacterized protein Z517_10801 [Fonsecaea pedrosoi CBS 271.37]KIW76056.1 hypothetical protein Z517_10801 [Fonsecaea pedrosoi CBS 271.37]
MQHDTALRAITTRLSITPAEDLPRICGFLATSLAQCPVELLSSDSKGNSSSVVAHKLKTRITALLQDKSTASRLSAAVLIKAIVDNGGLKVLSNWDVWARGLISGLGRHEPLEVKRIHLATVTRIFVLSQEQSVLLREVTTPLLPGFITACFGLIKPATAHVDNSVNPMLQSVLQCWIQLLPQHATVFRPFLSRIKPICLNLLEDARTTTSTRELTIQLLCLLLSCTPKNTIAQEWSQTASNLIDSAHQSANVFFRSVIEEYEVNDKARQSSVGRQDFSKEPKASGTDPMGLGQWVGMHDGSTRLATLLAWLGCLVSTPTSQVITVPLGPILDLTGRILAVTVPGQASNTTDTPKYNKETSREEKGNLWLNLPRLHVSCLRLIQKLCETYGQAFLSVHESMVNQVVESFVAMTGDDMVRREVYVTFSCLLSRLNTTGLVLRETIFSTLLEHCCKDLQRAIPGSDDRGNQNPSKDGFLSAKSTLSVAGSLRSLERRPAVYQAAWNLLPAILTHCPMISRQARIEADRLSVLLNHHDAMMASVMRPMLSKDGKSRAPSLLPFLARSAADCLDTEALLRPRMPVIQINERPAQEARDPPVHLDVQETAGIAGEDSQVSVTSEGTAEPSEAGVKQQPTIGPEEQEERGLQTLTARKRKLQSVQDGGSRADTPMVFEPRESLDSRLAKVPRLEDDSMEEVSAVEHPLPKPLVATRSEIEERSSNSGVQPAGAVFNMVSSETNGNPDSDSSDSEIPTIDPDLDTDEEDL